MRKYWAYYKIKLESFAAYRGQMLIWAIGNIIALITIISLVFSTPSGIASVYSKSELITYYLGSILLLWIVHWYPFTGVQNEIKDGTIVGKALLKPVSYYSERLSEDAAWHSVGVFVGLFVCAIFAVPLWQNLSFPMPLSSFPLLLISLSIASLLTFTLAMCMGLLAFWFTYFNVIDSFYWAVRMILAGQIVPLAFVPSPFQLIIKILPFRYLASFPLEIFMNKLNLFEITFGFVIGFSWLIAAALIYKVIWNKGVKAYTAFGS